MKPRALMILCEGTTEILYFESVKSHKRVKQVLPVQVFGKQGQHKNLIKKCVSLREKNAKELELNEHEIEVWAVCDRDNMQISYQKLQAYADERDVKLAFSDPQFETYLIQHFELKKTKKKGGELISELEVYLGEKYQKTDLSWFDNMIDEDPDKLNFAISNSNQLSNHTKTPFLTVQNLTLRLLDSVK